MYAKGKPPLPTALFSAAESECHKGCREKGKGLGLTLKMVIQSEAAEKMPGTDR